MQIIAIRAHTEGLNVEEAALAHLSSIAERASLRYAMQILTPASILAKEAYGRDQILLSDLKVPFLLFLHLHPQGISAPQQRARLQPVVVDGILTLDPPCRKPTSCSLTRKPLRGSSRPTRRSTSTSTTTHARREEPRILHIPSSWWCTHIK
jgi:hypothetical protein